MGESDPRLVGVELYFDDLPKAKAFYLDRLGLRLADEQRGHHARFLPGSVFLCLERRGMEEYPSADKAVVFLEVADLQRALERVGSECIAQQAPDASPPWAVVHDPEGHNVLLIEASAGSAGGDPEQPAAPRSCRTRPARSP